MMQSLSGSKTCATLPSSVVWTPSSLARFDLLLLLEASSNALFCWEFLFWLWHPIPVAVVAAPVGVVVVAGGGGVGCCMVLLLFTLAFLAAWLLRLAENDHYGRSILTASRHGCQAFTESLFPSSRTSKFMNR